MEPNKIAKLRDIVENGYNKVDGKTVDSFSASAIIKVYDALTDENKLRYVGLPVYKMADIAFKLLK
jgi:hypothetical protein